jgi:hypothetical protein
MAARLLAVVSLAIALSLSCAPEGPADDDGGSGADDAATVTVDNVTWADGALDLSDVPVVVEPAHLYIASADWAKLPTAVEPGHVVVGSDFLRRVLGVDATTNPVVLTTTGAALADAFATADLMGRAAFNFSSDTSTTRKQELCSRSATRIDCSGTEVYDDGVSTVTLEDAWIEIVGPGEEPEDGLITVEHDFSADPAHFKLLATGALRGRLVVNAMSQTGFTHEFTQPLWSKAIMRWFVGPVPVAVRLSIDAVFRAEMNAGVTLRAGGEASIDFVVGRELVDGMWHTISESGEPRAERIFEASTELSAGLHAAIRVRLESEAIAGKVKGPYVGVDAFGRVDVDLLEEAPSDCLVRAGVRAYAEGDIEVFNKKVLDFPQAELYCKERVWSDCGDGDASPFQDCDHHEPVLVGAAADATCATDRDGILWCWGNNQQGQLGIGAEGGAHSLRQVASRVGGITKVQGEGSRLCATANGIVYCSGIGPLPLRGGIQGFHLQPETCPVAPLEFGRGYTTFQPLTCRERSFPGVVEPLLGDGASHGPVQMFEYEWTIEDFALGSNEAVTVIRTDFYNRYFLSDGVATVPLALAGRMVDETDIGDPCYDAAAGTLKSCESGFCCDDIGAYQDWGGYCKMAPTANSYCASDRAFDCPLIDISCGLSHCCGIHPDGRLQCFRGTNTGEAGTQGATHDSPNWFSLEGVTDVDAGGAHTCAIADGAVYCWGNNAHGQVGGSEPSTPTPHQVEGVFGATAIATGGASPFAPEAPGLSCAIVDGGAVMCWGGPYWPTPTVIEGVDEARSIAVGAGHACAVTVGDEVKCWGRNDVGQLGDGTFDDRLTAIDVVEVEL